MLPKTFESYFLLFTIPIIISFIVGGLLIYFNYRRSVKIQKRLKAQFLFQIENEKIKISRELHDAVAPFTLPLKEFVKRRGSFTDENSKGWLSDINRFESYLSAINETIFPAELLEGDLFQALQKLAIRLSTDTKRIEVHSEVFSSLSRSQSIQIFRVLQECLINAFKYSNSNFINVINTQRGNDLISFVCYELKNCPTFDKSTISLRRGHKIILQRLELLSARHEVMVDQNIKTEKFIFKHVFQ